MPADFTLPPDNRAVGTGNPPADMDAVIDAMSAMGAAYNVLNAAYAGGADPTGTADSTAAIQAALTAAGTSPGSTVLVPPGTYLVSADLTAPSNVTIMGSGYASCLRRKPGPNYCNVLKLTSVSNVRITNLQVDGFKNEIITSSNGTVYATAIGYAYHELAGIYITGTAAAPCTNIKIDHCWIHDAFYGNIQPDAVNGLVIEANNLYLGRDNQVNARCQSGGGGGTCANVTVNGNVVTGTGYPFPSTADQFSGIQFIRATNVTITGNTCTGFGNTFTTEGDGIGLEGSRFVTIAGNTCTGNLSQGIKIDGTVEGFPDLWQQNIRYVPGDCVSNSAQTGIWQSNTYNQDAALPSVGSDNTAWTHKATGGSYWQNSVDVTAGGNTCSGNNFATATSINGYGVQAMHAEEVTVAGNTLSGNTQGFNQGPSLLSLVLEDNAITGSAQAGMTFYDNTVTNSNNGVTGYGPFIIRGNYVARNAQKGIDVVVPCLIDGNTVLGSGQAGIALTISGSQVSGSHPVQLVRGNTLIDNGDDGILVNGSYAYTCAVEIRGNYAPPSAVQPRLVGENGTACRCVNNRVTSQATELWYFTSTSSVWIDDTHAQMAASQALPYTVTGLEGEIVPVTGTGTLTLPHPGDGLHSPVGTGYYVTIANTGAGTATVTPASGTVAGAASVTVATHVTARFFFDGTSWWYA